MITLLNVFVFVYNTHKRFTTVYTPNENKKNQVDGHDRVLPKMTWAIKRLVNGAFCSL